MPAIELLAPAKDKVTAIAAINYGADAVYIGGPCFGAREKAGNSLADLDAVVRHAHLYAAKVYITINTLLLDAELETARRLIKDVYEIGADAVIIQDLGLLTADLPPLAVHASTQMHNNTIEKVRFLAQIGIKRAVLPREFNLREIAAVHAAVPEIELETFIHGALCVCYSGQCYLSYALGKRSANRGECAQPCRKKYSLLDEKGRKLAQDKHLLSLKDLCLANHLEDLLDAGVSSFKIEGRLKNINYVKNVVAYYRQLLDNILENKSTFAKTSAGRVYFDFTPDLNKTFNRKYTDYFIQGRRNDIYQPETPKALGEKLGRVQKSRPGLVKIGTQAKLAPGDGLCWFEAGSLRGANVNKVTAAGVELQNVSVIKVGTEIYRNYDQQFTKTLESSKTVRKLKVDVTVTMDELGLSTKAEDETGRLAFWTNYQEMVSAEDQDRMAAAFAKAFAKLGDTPFELNGFHFNGSLPFMSVSQINAMRREIMSRLECAKVVDDGTLRKSLRMMVNPVWGNTPYPIARLDFTGNVVNDAAKSFFASHQSMVAEMGAETGLELAGRSVMTTKHCLRYSFGQCLLKQNTTPSWRLIDEKGREYELRFNCNACVMQIIF